MASAAAAFGWISLSEAISHLSVEENQLPGAAFGGDRQMRQMRQMEVAQVPLVADSRLPRGHVVLGSVNDQL